MTSAAAPLGLIVTGTDTGVGKTHVAALIVRQLRESGLRAGAYKPVCSGATTTAAGVTQWDDVERLRAACGGDGVPVDRVCPQRWRAPLAPPLAARDEGGRVDWTELTAGLSRWLPYADHLVVEGVGGWLCPLTETRTFADWAAEIAAPILVVARPGLGTINHTLLTIGAIRQRRLPIAGVMFSHAEPSVSARAARDNAREIEARSGVPVLGEVPFGAAAVVDVQAGENGTAGSSGTLGDRFGGSVERELHAVRRAVRINWRTLMSPLGVAPGSQATR